MCHKKVDRLFWYSCGLNYLCYAISEKYMRSDSIVIIPTYNEKENIEAIIRAVTSLPKEFNVLVLDDGSPDGTAQIVKRLMEALPEAQREVVFMRYFQELSFKEIAEQTNVSINTSLGRMRYALINLRKMTRDNGMSLAIES